MGDAKEWEPLKGDIWQPTEVGEELAGVVTQINKGEYGTQYTIEVSPGESVETPSHRILQVMMARVKVGDEVRLVYKGDKNTGKGNPAKIYEAWRRRTALDDNTGE